MKKYKETTIFKEKKLNKQEKQKKVLDTKMLNIEQLRAEEPGS